MQRQEINWIIEKNLKLLALYHRLSMNYQWTQNSYIKSRRNYPKPKKRLIGSTLWGKRTKSCPMVAKKPDLATDFAGLQIPIEDPINVAVAASIYTSLQNPKTLL